MTEKKLKRTGVDNLSTRKTKMPVVRRRTVSIDQFVEETINAFRAGAVIKGLNYDFTTLINTFAEFGIRKVIENSNDPKFKEVLSKYLNYDEIQEFGLVDEWKDFQEFKEFKRKQQNKGALQ